MAPPDEEIARLLTDATNRAILTALNDGSRPLSVREIATQLVANDATPSPSDRQDIEQTIIALHHNHLPRLEEADLIEYDHEENIVTSGIGSASDAEWMDIDLFDELFSQVKPGSRGEHAVGLLEGRETVYKYSRKMADMAENELFLIFASDDLLDEDCIPYAENAIERGVTFHAGTKSHDARTFFREHLPEATIWDPQMDWMYNQSDCPKVSRLIVADRENVVVGLWDETDDGTKTEKALIGEGESNPLVVLVRELLGPRLDHLDYQSDSFLDGLPFEA